MSPPHWLTTAMVTATTVMVMAATVAAEVVAVADLAAAGLVDR
ncbi:MAG: hypothetical protein AAGD43_26640 [Pseudomonadota bacterium]